MVIERGTDAKTHQVVGQPLNTKKNQEIVCLLKMLKIKREMEAIMGIGFFQNHQFLLNEIKEITSHLETTEITIQNERKILTIYTFEDFLMLSNQGIFRESIFILDPQSRWKRKVSKLLTEYGYETVQSLMIEEERFYVISKK